MSVCQMQLDTASWLRSRRYINGVVGPKWTSKTQCEGKHERRMRYETVRDRKVRDRGANAGRSSPDLKFVGMTFSQGPDADERLRKLTALLLRLTGDATLDSSEENSKSAGSTRSHESK